ncbi:hypothetical protein O181_037756 [Austropuccinia psidii MF-1]|uniref:Integrase catalytic domain-containing protein n=1 Tax=Austropuccinia psidii MF-1 TaxID=1389203 RepID=A0A9Q3HB28_9BASI|nr:hypothetical protein [Austropuccinia psidii MF-1]
MHQAASFKTVRFLKKKSDAFSQFLLVKKGMENHHDITLRKLVSDHGGKFLNGKFNDLSRDFRLKNVFAPPETPHQNGFAERENGAILEKARCMLNKLPYTLWTGIFPKFQQLHTFGCRAIVEVLSDHCVWKFGETRCEGIFLGYKNKNTAYHFLCISFSKILTTKHVTFCENIFPFLRDNETNIPRSIIIEEPDSAIMAESHLTKEPMTKTNSCTWLYVHVNDIAIFCRDFTIFKEEVALELDTKDIGPADLMLGIKVNQFDDVITLDQQHFSESLVHLYGMAEFKPVATPLMPNTHLQPSKLEYITKLNSLNVNFRSSIGSINYLRAATQPDISFAVSSLWQFLEKPGFTHWQSFRHVLRYLKGTQSIGLSYAKNMTKGVVSYSDADWGSFSVTQRSVTGHCTILHGCLVLWKTKKQRLVSLSTAEAEYKALCDLTSDLFWLLQWCREAKIFEFFDPITVFDENKSCIKTAAGNINLNHKHMKHVDIQLYFIREEINTN